MQPTAGAPAWTRAVDMDAPPPPFRTRNPSAWGQRIPIAVLAVVATAMSGYMACFQWGWIESVWDPVFGDGTETVLSSPESHRMFALLHVPDAAFGGWGYFTEAILSLVGSTRRWQFRPWLVILFGLDVIPLGIVSTVLVFVQGLVIGSWCFLCLITAAISLVLVVMAFDEVWASVAYLMRVWRATRDPRLLWSTFIGRGSEAAHRLAGVS